MAQLQTVQHIYESFGRGDVPAILVKLAPDVDWEYGGGSTDVPWLQPRRGREHVAGFFEALREVDFHSFAPKAFFEAGPVVVVLVDLEATVRATGRRITEIDEVHIWRFDAAGQVSGFCHRADTYKQWAAYHG